MISRRTLNAIEKDLEQANVELEPIRDAYKNAINKVTQYERELLRFKIDNKMYHPMSDLLQYTNKSISSIELIVENDEGVLDIDIMCGDYMCITEDGHLDYSDTCRGVVEWDESKNTYVMYRRGYKSVMKIYGFMGISLNETE